MEPRGATERNKEALRSETWQEAREAMSKEVQHFTETPEVKNLDAMKVSGTDNVYGVRWGNLVRDYLKTAYSGEDAEAEIVSWGVTYKVLRRKEVTVFYNAGGDTLFDVENGRLEKEFEWLMDEDSQSEADTGGSDAAAVETAAEGGNVESVKPGRETADSFEKVPAEKASDDTPDGKDMPADAASAKPRAKEKLEKELETAKDKSFADPVIGYLLNRCEEDEGLAQDVAQDHKTWEKCLGYIYRNAQKQAVGNQAVVRDEVVFEWAEDYYHEDDKAEGEAKPKEKQKKKAAAKKSKAKEKHDKKTSDSAKKEETAKKRIEPKKSGKDMEGQLDLFSMMGM